MKKFNIIQYKECPSCGFNIKPEVKHAYDNNWCPHCGFGYKETIQKKNQNILVVDMIKPLEADCCNYGYR